MKAVCKMTDKEVKWPCGYAGCPLFGDCLVSYEKATAKPITNADHIRSMTDEELAVWIFGGISCDSCDYCECGNEYCDGTPCKGKTDAEIIADWLKQPYEK